MTRKEQLLDVLYEQLRKGELEDKSLITKIELGDERFVNNYLEKTEAMRKSMEENAEKAPAEGADDAASEETPAEDASEDKE